MSLSSILTLNNMIYATRIESSQTRIQFSPFLRKAGDRHPSHFFVVDVKHRLNKTRAGRASPRAACKRLNCY